MKKEEKQTLYNFLDKAESCLRGFEISNKNQPSFSDDEIVEQIEKPKTSGITLSTLTDKVKNCTRCQLCKQRTNTVFGIGVEHPLVMVIGEGPGKDEDEKGEPFVGKAGQLLDKMLQAIHLSRDTNCYIANVVKCRPPANRDPFPDEANSCMPYLETQIHILKPTMILAMGKVAAHNLFKTSDPVIKMRGNLYDYNGIPAMMTYHPSALLRDESLKRPAWEDLKLFRSRLDAKLHELALTKE